MSNAFNITVTNTSFTASSGGTLGASIAATINSGSALPVNAATHWRLAIVVGVSVSFSVDATVARGVVTAVRLEDAVSTAPPDGYSAVGGITTWTWSWAIFDSGGGWPTDVPLDGSITTVPDNSFNCDCESVSPWDTLLNVRRKMMIRLGYPNQLTNPPPGMALLIDQFLRDAQEEIYLQLQRAALRTERFFKWTMVPGQRYYAFSDEEESCAVLNPYKVTWVGFEDLNEAWYRMDEGIPPEYYTRANINFGWPTRFELRSCIEIFPAPQAAYTLWIKGDFGLAPLVADADRFTISDIAVYLLALGNAKAHYGQKDAQLVLTQAGNYSKSLVGGTHGTKRYVNQSGTGNTLTPPKFLPLGDAPP